MTKLRTAPAARNDIREIRDYSKDRFGPAMAKEYLNGLVATFALIQARPLIGIVELTLGQGMRSFGYRSHRIYYRLDRDAVLVVRILHQARDVPGAFSSSQ